MAKPRVIITTDLECDDMNSLIHLCLYLNEFETEGIVYTSSQFHFNGDGVHTLGEVTPNYRCQGLLETEGHIGYPHPDPEAKDLMAYRPFEEGWIENLIRNEYAEAYPYLSQNAEGFPTPEEILSKIVYGNYEFEGDIRFDTEGSMLIERCILDEREDPLYLESWGGVNTIVRALLSIYEHFSDTADWEMILRKVVDKVRVLGVWGGQGQDNSWLDADIFGKFPGIQCLRSDFGYVSFMSARTAQEDVLPMLKGNFMYPHFKIGHGPLMAKYGLYGDGTVYEGEADKYQFGLTTTLNWSYDNMPEFHFDQYDVLGEGDSGTYIPLMSFGLRGLEDYRYGTLMGTIHVETDANGRQMMADMGNMAKRVPRVNPFLKAYHEDFAARANWCVKSYAECNHNPSVLVAPEDLDLFVKPGETVTLQAMVEDERPYAAKWWLYGDGCVYGGDLEKAAEGVGTSACIPMEDAAGDDTSCIKAAFTVPADAKPGDFFNLILTVKNEDENPMTSYGQIIVHVEA